VLLSSSAPFTTGAQFGKRSQYGYPISSIEKNQKNKPKVREGQTAKSQDYNILAFIF